MAKRRNFDMLSEAQLAAGRMEPRRVTGLACFRPGGARPVAELLDAIEHVAEAATGERSFLHLGGRAAVSREPALRTATVTRIRPAR
ncbi:hypothetical protein [Methylobacterium sp. J-076]|uniref:hypothetical protein n=1 Tax=Methylobacterium sp. J-076 TaxID=2836655 RepID=UPI001FBB6042|nr:hypothetical protein [Methylobacterium sp. J-076]MCJ2012504.1 hypothetical protein [Methylobacterium sp. J-076]